MKIAITGIPSGKSELAKRVQYTLNEENFQIVDNYAQELSNTLNLELGDFASHTLNFLVAGRRITKELVVQDLNTITVGTTIDSTAYAALLHDQAMISVKKEDRDQMMWIYARTEGLFGALGLLLKDNWNYDLVFYNPPPDDVSIEHLKVDYAIRDYIELLGFPVVKLQGEFYDKVDTIVTLIKDIRDNESK